jgi:NMD protein affecting ribosome stability and mRNA decay
MKTTRVPQHRPVVVPRDRRIAGRAQRDHILDPYQRKEKLEEGTACPQCGAVYHGARWQWGVKAPGAAEELCSACRRINDKFPAGILTMRGAFVLENKDEILRLARHQEEVEKAEHPMNRILSIEEDAEGIVINTTDIHLPRRIGETVKRAFHGKLRARYEQDGYFARVTWTPPA